MIPPPKPPQRVPVKRVVPKAFPTHTQLAKATIRYTVKNAPQTEKGGLNRSANSPTPKITSVETEFIHSSTVASARLPTAVSTETENYLTNGTATVNISTISLPIKDDTDAIHSKGFKQK